MILLKLRKEEAARVRFFNTPHPLCCCTMQPRSLCVIATRTLEAHNSTRSIGSHFRFLLSSSHLALAHLHTSISLDPRPGRDRFSGVLQSFLLVRRADVRQQQWMPLTVTRTSPTCLRRPRRAQRPRLALCPPRTHLPLQGHLRQMRLLRPQSTRHVRPTPDAHRDGSLKHRHPRKQTRHLAEQPAPPPPTHSTQHPRTHQYRHAGSRCATASCLPSCVRRLLGQTSRRPPPRAPQQHRRPAALLTRPRRPASRSS